MTTKIGIKHNISINTYAIISRAVEEGVEYGWNRAYKYTDKPSKEVIITAIEDAVMLNLSEILIYNAEGEDADDKKDK